MNQIEIRKKLILISYMDVTEDSKGESILKKINELIDAIDGET